MTSLLNPYVLIGAFVVLIGLCAGSYYKGYQHAVSESAAEVAKYRESEIKAIEELQEAKDKRAVVYRDRVRIVEAHPDSCLDAPIPDDIRLLLPGGKAK